MTNLILFFTPYLIGSACGWLYRRIRLKLGKPAPLRPLYQWEKIIRRCLVAFMAGIMLVHDVLASQGLALRPNLNTQVTNLVLISVMIWLSLVIVRRLAKQWHWGSYLGTLMCLLPATFYIWFMVHLFGNHFEYDIVTENGRTYLHTSGQDGWHDHYVHKYAVVNDYLMKSKAADYDIARLSERQYNLSYEEKYFSSENITE